MRTAPAQAVHRAASPSPGGTTRRPLPNSPEISDSSAYISASLICARGKPCSAAARNHLFSFQPASFDSVAIIVQPVFAHDPEIELRLGIAALGGFKQVLFHARRSSIVRAGWRGQAPHLQLLGEAVPVPQRWCSGSS